MSEENTKQTNREWTKPELLVLVRSNPEEAVLRGYGDTHKLVTNYSSRVRLLSPARSSPRA